MTSFTPPKEARSETERPIFGLLSIYFQYFLVRRKKEGQVFLDSLSFHILILMTLAIRLFRCLFDFLFPHLRTECVQLAVEVFISPLDMFDVVDGGDTVRH